MSSFTHIVVGAGSAGCVVARRIAENKSFNVLVIEAGPDIDPLASEVPHGVRDARRVPMKGQSEVYDSRIDWNVSVEVPGASPMVVPQAKVMGGGSSINGGTALRSTEADSKEWMELGNNSWDFESISRVYDSLEGDELRVTRGPHPIARFSVEDAGKIQQAFITGAKHCGFKQVLDLNSKGAEGVGASPVCRVGDRRISLANTFIDPIREWDNLTMLSDSLVDRVIFDAYLKAKGVILADGRAIQASHEVVLCAGAIFSPAILQRSGVGLADSLRSHAIPPLVDLPVGLNLADHACIPIVARPRPGAYDEGDYSLQMQARWSSSELPGAIDLQMVCFSYLFTQPSTLNASGQRSLGGTASGHVAGVGCNVNKPTSLGSVVIKSKDPNEVPTVAPNYFSTPFDRKVARELLRKAYPVMVSPPMQKVLSPPLGLTDGIIASDLLLDQYIKAHYSTTYHFCGSCRMATRDNGGVVDQSGRVYGVLGLRVADASVIPTVPASNTMWTTVMFGERIGRSIRDGRDVGKDYMAKL
jgi:choline dehydrogenase